MPPTVTAGDDHDPAPTATAPVGAVYPPLPPDAVIRDCHEGLRGYKARRDSLLAEATREDIDRAGHRPRWSVLDALGVPQGPHGMTGEGA
jgi:hypothetical protein